MPRSIQHGIPQRDQEIAEVDALLAEATKLGIKLTVAK